ncbi:hypothetical protein MRX96_030930 [Rhipicephalus microplus]
MSAASRGCLPSRWRTCVAGRLSAPKPPRDSPGAGIPGGADARTPVTGSPGELCELSTAAASTDAVALSGATLYAWLWSAYNHVHFFPLTLRYCILKGTEAQSV